MAWEAQGYNVYDPDGDTPEGRYHIATAYTAEHARLIAAAPDLLRELKELVETFSGDQGMKLSRAKAVIARAESKEPSK